MINDPLKTGEILSLAMNAQGLHSCLGPSWLLLCFAGRAGRFSSAQLYGMMCRTDKSVETAEGKIQILSIFANNCWSAAVQTQHPSTFLIRQVPEIKRGKRNFLLTSLQQEQGPENDCWTLLNQKHQTFLGLFDAVDITAPPESSMNSVF